MNNHDFTSLKPCLYCEEHFGEIEESPKCVSFENKKYLIDVNRTWIGTKWGSPSSYVLRHWCPWMNNSLIKISGESIEDLIKKWNDF